MDSTNSPQSDTTQPATTPDVPTEATPTTPTVQEAEATINLPKPGSHHFPKPFLIGLSILFVLIVVGVVGNYFLIAKYASTDDAQVVPAATSDTTNTIVSPTPLNEQEEVDKVDTTFPESDLKTIETDLKGL